MIEKDGLSISYDSAEETYYATQEVEIDPGQSIVKTIMIEDVWRISEEELIGVSEEAKTLFLKLQGSDYESKARLLISNIEVLLTQIYELQKYA